MRFFVSIFILFAFPLITNAQYNDTVNFNLHVSSTGTLNKTATSNAYVLSNALNFGVRRRDLSFNMHNSWLYGEQERKLTNNDVNSNLNVNLFKTLPRFYYWGLGTFTSSVSLKINNQYQAGLGIAYSFVDKSDAFFNLSDGVLYEYSDIVKADSSRDLYNTFRNSFRVSYKYVIRKLIVFNGAAYFQNSLSVSNDYIIKTDIGLGIKVVKWLTFSANFKYNRFNRTARENMLVHYGLTIDQYF
jgi:hypothetical protein